MTGVGGTIRAVQSSEAAAIRGLAMRSKAYWGYSQEFLERCRDELNFTCGQLASDRYSFCLYEISADICGFYAIDWRPPSSGRTAVCELEALFVDPPFIGQRIGKALMEHAKQTARQRRMTRVIVQGDPNAADFYRAAGGIHAGERESASIAGRFLPVYEFAL